MVPCQVLLWITQLMFSTRYLPLRFIACAIIGHWSSGCHNTGMFQTSSTLGIEAISGLIPIYLHLKKLYGRFLLWELSLLSNHIINNILSSNRSQEQSCYNVSIDYLMAKQKLYLKSLLININDKCNEFFPSFSFSMRNLNQGTVL